MSVKSGQAVTVLFSTANASTGAATDATGTPAGTLYVNGTANGASVTVTNITTGVYKAAVTLPSLTAGDVVSLRIAATVSAVAGEGVIWQEVGDTERVSDLNDLTAAAVNAEVDTALADIHLDHLLAVADSDTPVNNSIIAKLAAGLGDWSDYNPITMSHEKIAGDISATKTAVGTPSNLGSGATVAANLADIEGQTDDIGAAGAGLTALGDTRIANLDATVSSRASASTLTTIGSRIGTFTGSGVNNIKGYLEAMARSDATLPSDIGGTFDDATDSLQAIRDNTGTPAGASVSADIAAVSALISALNNLSAAQVNAEVVDVIRTDTIPDSVAADGSPATIAQAVYLMLQFLTEKVVSGTTVTVKKPDGSTSLATFTLDDGTSPSSITRAS